MESSPNQNTIHMGGRIEAALASIDAALEDYELSEHRRIDSYLVQGLVAKEVEVIPVEP